MRTWLKLLIGLTLVGAAVAALIYLNRRKTATGTTGTETSPALASQMWAVSDALQQSHLTALTAQVSDRPSRSDVAQMIQQAMASIPAGTTPQPVETDTDFVALFDAQMN